MEGIRRRIKFYVGLSRMGYYMDGSKQEQIVILLINFMKRVY